MNPLRFCRRVFLWPIEQPLPDFDFDTRAVRAGHDALAVQRAQRGACS